MADPHHVEPLDGFDRLTVRLYRAGIALAAASVGALAAGWPAGRVGVLVATGLMVANLHLYDRRIRWFVGVSGWTGAVLSLGGAGTLAGDAGLGFCFVVCSAVALKERYCFRLPIVVAIPPLLAASLVPLRLGFDAPARALLALGAAALAVLFVGKARMPLTHDIGNRAYYQV